MILSRLRSNYSNPPGGSSIPELLSACARSGWKQVILADTNLCGAHAFGKLSVEKGLIPVYALDISDGSCHVVLISRNQTGYSNLCRLLTAKNLDRTFSLERHLPPRQNGIITLCRDLHSLTVLAHRLNRGYLYAEILRPGSFRHERQLLERARKLGVHPIASADIRYVDTSQVPRLNMLTAIRANRMLSDITPDPGCYSLLSPAEFRQRFADIPRALQSLERVSESCDGSPWGKALIFPRLPGSAEVRLRQAAARGVQSRYPALTEAVRQRLDYEIHVVLEMGFADYFLVVAEIVDYARTLGSPVACRGSGAGSLLAYCLHISNVDPIRYNLPFERFLNEGRDDAPDLDIDLCHLVRDKVIQHVFERYGAEHVAMISTHIALQPRSAIRLCAKALGIPEHGIKALQARADGRGGVPAHGRRSTIALEAAMTLVGAPHHLSLHPGGILITPDAIAGHTPLIRSPKGVIASMYDKDGVEAAGLVKIDLLGNRALSSFGEASTWIHDRTGQRPDPEKPPPGDDKTVALLSHGNTLGVNQLESPAMRRLLVQMSARTPVDVMRALALIRPGAAGMGTKQSYIDYARGESPLPLLTDSVQEVLGESYGLLIYEDDILQLLHVLAGMTAGEAQVFRKALCRCRHADDRKPLAAEFFLRTKSRGVPTHAALEMWAQMCKFNAYSFCRAHAASYGLLAWSGCWVKAHYPREFWIGALNHNQGMYPIWVYAEAIKQAGIPLLPPSVNTSAEAFTLEQKGIRCGLSLVAGLSAPTQRAIIRARPFCSFQAFIHRVPLGIHEQRALIRAGALDCFPLNRPQMLALTARGRPLAELRQSMPGLFDYGDAESPVPAIAPFSASQRFTDEWRHLGLSVGEHPVHYVVDKPNDTIQVAPLTAEMEGTSVTMRGMIAARRRVTTDNGKPMCFLTLADEGGLTEVTVAPEVYEEYASVLHAGGLCLHITGNVINQSGCLSVQAETIEGDDGAL